MINEKNSIQNECIYSDDKSHRYLLSRIWNKDKPIALFVTKNAGQANLNNFLNPLNTVSIAQEIKQYKELLGEGIITQDEFDAKKKQLLGL